MGVETSPVTNKEWWTAQQGQYFVAVSPTPGTGIAGHAAPTTFDEEKPILMLYNDGNAPIYPQYLHLHCTAASTGGSRVQFTMTMDKGNRRTVGGTALTVNNTNAVATAIPGAVVYFGAVTASAATTYRRLLGNIVYRGTIDVVEDDYIMIWGAPNAMSGSTSRVATVAEASRILPPVCLAPGYGLYLTQWAASQSGAPSFEVILGLTSVGVPSKQ